MSGKEIFVFGSNRAGRHGKGAALFARQNHGAIYGRGEGLQGRSYAIPTKDEQLRTLPVDAIAAHVVTFIEFALSHPHLTFRVTPIGCGLAGYQPKDIAWMFDAPCPRNVVMPPEFVAALTPAPPVSCTYCGDTKTITDRVDGEITCPECGYDKSNPKLLKEPAHDR